MKSAGIVILQLTRAICWVVAAWQVIGLLPVLTWLGNPSAVTAGMMAMVVIKGLLLAICIAAAWGLRKAITRMKGSAAQAVA